MIQINLASLVKHLNQLSRQALEAAAAECMGQQASEITVAHVLLQMLTSVRSDVRVIAEKRTLTRMRCVERSRLKITRRCGQQTVTLHSPRCWLSG